MNGIGILHRNPRGHALGVGFVHHSPWFGSEAALINDPSCDTLLATDSNCLVQVVQESVCAEVSANWL